MCLESASTRSAISVPQECGLIRTEFSVGTGALSCRLGRLLRCGQFVYPKCNRKRASSIATSRRPDLWCLRAGLRLSCRATRVRGCFRCIPQIRRPMPTSPSHSRPHHRAQNGRRPSGERCPQGRHLYICAWPMAWKDFSIPGIQHHSDSPGGFLLRYSRRRCAIHGRTSAHMDRRRQTSVLRCSWKLLARF